MDFYDFQCAQAVALDAKSLAECYNSEEGKLQQLTAEKDTTNVLNAPLKSVPTIVFNEVNMNVVKTKKYIY